jgi:transcriptional regulator with XRE-family HTH domain
LRQDAAAALAVLAGELRALRDRTPLTLQKLSRATNISVSSLSRYFTGQALPAQETVEILGELCGGDVAQLQTLWEAAASARRRLRAVTHAGTGEVPAAAAPAAGDEDEPAPAGQLRRRFHLPENPFRRRPVRYAALAMTVAALMALTGITVHTLTVTDAATGGEISGAAAPAAAGPLPGTPTAGHPPVPSSAPATSPAPAVPVPRSSPAPRSSPVPREPSLAPAPTAHAVPPPDPTPDPPGPGPTGTFDELCQFSNSSRQKVYWVQAFVVEAGGTLSAGQVCQIGQAQLAVQRDGDLVVRIAGKKEPQWKASWTRPEVLGRGRRATFQADHNFGDYDANGAEVWASGIHRSTTGGRLAIQSDGNVVVYDDALQPLWTTKTQQEP